MNPLLFADWRRLNRLFTRAMWTVAAVIACVICIALLSSGPASPPTAGVRGTTPGAATATASAASGSATAGTGVGR